MTDGLESRGKPKPGYGWGKPKDYVELYRKCGSQYQRQLLAWLEWQNEPLHKLVLKELARDDRQRHSDAGNKGKASQYSRGGGEADAAGGFDLLPDEGGSGNDP